MQIKFLSSENGLTSWQIDNATIMLKMNPRKGHKLIPIYIEKVRHELEAMNSVAELSKEIGIPNFLRLSQGLFPELFRKYLLTKASAYTEQRIKITINDFMMGLFGRISHVFDSDDISLFRGMIASIVRDEYALQCKYFIETNRDALNLNQSSWTLFWLDGQSLCSREFDFGKIDCPSIRQEIMVYFKDRLITKTRFRNDEGISLVTRAANYLTEYRPAIKCFAHIREIDVASLLNHLSTEATSQFNKPLAPGTVSDIIGDCGMITSFLMNPDNDVPKEFPRPNHNHFKDVDFRNLSNMEKRTLPIPDCVIDQIYLHLDDLLPIHQIVFRVFDGTGLRADEVVLLEDECLHYMKEKDEWFLKHIPNKVLAARRKNKLPDYHKIGISLNEVELIQAQIKKSGEYRKKTGLRYIFLHEMIMGHMTAPIKVVQAQAFNTAINRLIKKHNIVDESGNMWHFTSRQFRKKVAINMIENGATPREVGHHFGHMEERTNIQYYSEVAEIKLAELNTEFFKKKFEIEMGPEQLALYTEDERRALYVDFRMNRREVELGSCTRHISQGPCTKMSEKTACATCGNICTGKKYLSKWVALRDSQSKIVNELIAFYNKERITNYNHFREYQKELYLFQSYQATINKIMESNIC